MKLIFKKRINYIISCIIICFLIYPTQAFARKVRILSIYQAHIDSQNGFNIVNSNRVEAGKDNGKKYDENGNALPFKGISLITDIGAGAKEQLSEEMRKLKGDRLISSKINFVSLKSLHMTIADLITSNRLYEDPTAEIEEQDREKLLGEVIGPAFEEFINAYTDRGVELSVEVNGIGMFPQGILFFSVNIGLEQFLELKALRDEIKFRLEEQFGKGKSEDLHSDYVTHITIGYLKEDVVLEPSDFTDREIFGKLIELDARLRENPIRFVIREGKVVAFKNLNDYNGTEEQCLHTINFEDLR